MKKINYRHIICALITLGFLTLSVFCFPSGIKRLAESCIDVKNSFVFYFCELFGINSDVHNTVIEFSAVKVKMPFNLPDTWDDFVIAWKLYWKTFASLDNVKGYFSFLGDSLYNISKILLIVFPLFSCVCIVNMFKGEKQNNDYNQDSKALKRFKRFERKICLPVASFFKQFFAFVRQNSFWWKIWVAIWSYNFNFIVIVLEFFAYYFFFIVDLSFGTLYVQVVKLFCDLCAMLNFVPLFVWIVLALVIINVIRRKIGYAELNHREMQNRGFINERPIVMIVCGTMGKKKTTMISDIALSETVILRDKAFEKILECDLKFPFFPWINFENALKTAIRNHSVYNLATCRRFVQSKKQKFFKRHFKRYIFGYDFQRYPCEYDNKLFIENIWKVLEDYAQLYFIYTIESSLIVSNYSIKVRDVLESVGNFPLWNSDFFKRNSRLSDAYARHSHILDFDSIRLGKKVLADNRFKDSFEFGVINITEIGKERGNNLELQEIKKNTTEANQKNDLFNSWLKLVRHSATVCNYPFVKVITDEQRPESWGADARDLCEIVYIDDCSDLSLTMPFFSFGNLFFGWWANKFTGKYYQYRFNRADNTLGMYLYHGISALFNRYVTGIYNTFGYYSLSCTIENGRQDMEPKRGKYYLMCAKIYAKIFSTDCFSEFFNEKSLRSAVGLNDLPEFKTEKATFDELLKENSYFFNDLIRLKNKDE